MGRETTTRPVLSRERIAEYLGQRFGSQQVVEIAPLGEDVTTDLKDYGYGRPLLVLFRTPEGMRRVVIRTMSADPFGHDRRADRVAALTLARDTFGQLPRHIRALDVGALDELGHLRSASPGEPFLVTDYVEGTLYAEDLQQLAQRDRASALDLERAGALAEYLAALHRKPAPPMAYERAVRDLVGSGEGIFGLCDAYRPDDAVATPARLAALERAAVAWRWRLRPQHARACRTHGDFHPFNLLFREGADLSVLDCSRGAAGDAADDVTCLSVNYIFFSALSRPRDGFFADGPYRALWDRFWRRYQRARHDEGLFGVVAPFFAWRLLVVACPMWYPSVAADVRHRLLRFAERLLGGASFDPSTVDDLLR